jgi:porphobilinogen synthase
MNAFPDIRLRRLRQTEGLRNMFGQAMPGPGKFIWPIFVVEGRNKREAIDAMPGQFRWSTDMLLRELEPAVKSGMGGIMIFGVVPSSEKDPSGSAASRKDGVVQNAVRQIRREFSGLVVATDVCFCGYTDHGHCGFLDRNGDVDNDVTNAGLARIALSHAEAGAHVVAPSAMMDGQVAAIRAALDQDGFTQTLLMSYSTKFASSMYGPFRVAEQSAPKSGDRKGYQAPHNDLRQALRESVLDEAEGADILMVKPALFNLDVLCRLREQTRLPIAAYNVSGEYAMLVASADRGWGDLRNMVRESTQSIVRAGADIILSYWANRYDEFFRE